MAEELELREATKELRFATMELQKFNQSTAAEIGKLVGKELQSYLITRLKELITIMMFTERSFDHSEIVKIRDDMYADIGNEVERLIQIELGYLDMQADKSLRKTFLDLGIID